MAGRKRNINMFLMDGEANGLIKITTKPWNGLLLRMPRNRLYNCGERDEMKYSSIYFLIGPNETGSSPNVYVGQVGMRGILKRLTEHDKNPDKSFWTEAIVLTTSGNGLGATELNYLEHTFYTLAVKSKQCIVKNALEPTPGNINEETESELAETVELTQIILEALGYKFLTESPVSTSPFVQQEPIKPVPVRKKANITFDSNKKIGKFVREDLVKLFESGCVPEEEFENLTQIAYCKNTFKKKVFFPVLVEWPENVPQNEVAIVGGYSRYYSDIVLYCANKRYLLSSQWYKETYAGLLEWCNQYVQK